MSDTTEDVKRLFKFEARTVAAAEGDALEVDVTNVSGAAWGGFLFIELKLPTKVAAPKVGEAALAARTATAIQNMASLAGVVTAAEGWSVWAINYPNDSVVVVRVFNGIDQQDGSDAESITALAADAVLKLRIPLAPAAVTTQFEMEYGYQTGEGAETRVDGSLVLTPSSLGKWKPEVSFTCSHRNPTMIEPNAAVDIRWSVKDGVAATLRGPLPGGNSELTLSRDTASDFRIDKGSMTLLAVGPATYVLDAEVKGPEGQPNVQVVRTLALDIYSPSKYASVAVHPGWVLPNGEVEINWAVWGVEKASLKVGSRDGIELELTQQNLNRTYQGSGTMLVHALNDEEESVSLTFSSSPKQTAVAKATIQTSPWLALKKAAYTGKPLALALADAHMALLTSDGLYTGLVGRLDMEVKSKLPAFVKSAATGKAWHALAAFGNEFVVLRRTDGDDAVLERYDGKGQRVGLPVTLPEDFQTLARRDGAQFDLASLDKRAYVVAEAPAFGMTARSAYSVRFEPDVNVRPEGSLARLLHYRLLSFSGALYAYHRGTGRMLRFGLKNADELDEPRTAARAVNARGVSMIRTGLLVPVGPVLAVLDPAALPSFESLRIFGFGLNNALDAALQCLKEERDPDEIPQDLCYNPQHDTWTPCGHGLDIQHGAFAVYRGGKSRRLWVLQPDGVMHTLTSANEELFARDFIDKLHPKDLPPALDSVRQFKLSLLMDFDLVPVDDVCRAAGLEGLGAEGVAELSPSPSSVTIQRLRPADFTLRYNSTDTTSVTLRFMLANPPGPRHFFEMNFSGAGLGKVTTVFKRLATDGRLDEIPGTLKTYPKSDGVFPVISPQPLLTKTRLLILNGTPEELQLSPNIGRVGDSTAVEVSATTPDLTISTANAEKAGRVRVTFDYARPLGIEMSPAGNAQEKLIRIVTNESKVLEASADHLEFISSVVFTFEKYDGSRSGRMPQPHAVYWCRVGMKKKFELDGVRIGDAAATRDGKSIFVTLARPEDVKKIRVMRIDTDGLETSELAVETTGNVYSVPNAVAVSDNYYYAMFAENVWHQATRKFEFPFTITLDRFKEIVAFAASAQGHVYYVSKKEQGFGEGRQIIYALWYAPFPNHSKFEIPIQPSLFANAIPTLAISPDGNTAALCDVGGLIVVDVTNKSVQPFRPGNLREPGHAVFSPDGRWIYCVHLTSSLNFNPRLVVSGRDITITRVRVGNLNERQSLSLPNVEGNFSVTANTKQAFGVNVSSKEQVALTLAVSPDNRFLFVSAGTSIMKIATDSFTLHPWRANTELPSRLVCVKSAGANAYTVYALGSYYRGDGIKVEEYKTHLYAVPAPVA